MGDRQPVVDATVKVWAANPTPGAAATLLGTTQTNEHGKFSLDLNPEPAAGQIVYATAVGGNAGGGTNNAIRLATVAGAYCSGNGCGFADIVDINELSSIAMAYSLGAYTDVSDTTLNVSGPAAGPGLENAALTFASLVDAESGTSVFQEGADCTGSDEPDNCYTLRKLDTLANIVAACVNSSGPASSACDGLFSRSGSVADTFSALFNLARVPSIRNKGNDIFTLTPDAATAYSPVLAKAPNDWTLALAYTGGGLKQAAGMAVDAEGNVWVADYITHVAPGEGALSKFSPVGEALSPPDGFSGGGLYGSWGVAIDDQGNAWVANWNGGDGKIVSEIGPDGTPVSSTGYTLSGISPGPYAITIAPDGTIWVGDYGNSSLSKLDASGNEIARYQGGGIALPVGIGVDAQGNVWTANYANASVSEFAPAAATWLSPSSGYTGGGLSGPQGLALDALGNAWIANFYGPNYPAGDSSITELVGGSTPPASCPQNPGAGDTGCPLSPQNGFMGGGLYAAAAPAVDSDGHVFVTNYHGNSVSELSTSDGSVLSPADGYRYPAINLPGGIAIDASGNLWVVNFAPAKLIKFIGLAAPVKTPLRGLPKAP